MASLLIFTPTWLDAHGKEAMRPECRAAITAQRFQGEQQWLVGLSNPYPIGSHQNVLHQYQQARQYFLDETSADALLLVEHDNVLPDAYAAQRLYDTPADVVYGVYLLRHGSNVLNAWRYEGERNLGMSYSLYPTELQAARRSGRPVRVSGCGFGCLLIRRTIVARFPFRKGDSPDQWAPDIPFALDVLRAGVVSVARIDVACDHYDGELRLRPFGGPVMSLVRVTALANINVLIEGQSVRLTAGVQYDLPRESAGELVRAGYLRVDEVQTATADPVERTAVEARPKRRRAG